MSYRVLFLAPNPAAAANTRYRVLQYLPYLNANGFQCTVYPFLSDSLFQDFYSPGGWGRKTRGLLGASVRRLAQVLTSHRYNVVVILREAMLFGPPIAEWLLEHLTKRPIVFDFDDAVFLPYVSPTYGRAAMWLKCAGKTTSLVKMSRHVLAGSPYLAEYARRYNTEVTLLPTVVDTDRYAGASAPRQQDDRPVIGWVGTHSTARYLEIVRPALEELARRHSFRFRVIGAGRTIEVPGVVVENRPWRLESELEDIKSFDIGIYPLPDDEWTRGKCAFKAIQYLAAGVPCVCSPVGMTRDVVENGVSGLHATTSSEWTSALERMLTEPPVRRRLARAGFDRVEAHFSLERHAPRLAAVLRAAAGTSRASDGSALRR